MIRRNKVWFALWVMLLANLFAVAHALAQTTYTVDVNGAQFTPSSLPNLLVGDSVFIKIKDNYHTIYKDGTLLLGRPQFSGDEILQTFTSDGTFTYSDTRFGSTLTVTVVQPVNAAPSVSVTIPTNHAAIAVTNSSGATNIALRVNAEDGDANGSIRRVQFYYGTGTNVASLTNLIGTFTNSVNTNNTVFNFTWSNAVPGRYLLQARAYDNLEVFANSPRINLSLYTPFTNSLPAITNISGVDNLVIRFNANTGLVYVVEVSTNLTNWQPVTTNVATNSLIEVLDPNLDLTNRFYRLRLVP
ncbi:MAG TPA: hypothetical protein VGH19_05120 [Verrucomicrobiae bacterium]